MAEIKEFTKIVISGETYGIPVSDLSNNYVSTKEGLIAPRAVKEIAASVFEEKKTTITTTISANYDASTKTLTLS